MYLWKLIEQFGIGNLKALLLFPRKKTGRQGKVIIFPDFWILFRTSNHINILFTGYV